ncbi:MAG: DNA polymerase III subunit beta [Patescibacteria group bacterium]|nr:DNA polymerase III subunit beta [Patescibacteria group bacterium]
MKLIILQEKLKNGLNIVERITSKSLSLPILNNVLISAEKNFLKLTSTNLEIGINWWSLAQIEKEEKITVPASIFSNFVSFLPNKKLVLEIKDKTLLIDCENFKTQIKGISAEDFPIIPEVPREEFFEIETSPFCQGLSQIVDIAVPSTARPEISGIYFSFQKNKILMAATDSFRLGEKSLFLEKETPFKAKEISFILPQRAAKEIINIFSGKNGKLKLYFSPHQVLFESELSETPHPQIQLVSRLIEGEYPAYQEIIPKKYQTQIILNKNDFINQVKIAALFSGKINEVKFKIDPKRGGVEILSQNPDLGKQQNYLRGEIKGESLEISFNHRFLIDGLNSIRSSEIIFELNGEEGPGVLKPVGDSSYIYVVMPIKAS